MPTLNDKKKKFKFPSSTLMLFSIIVIIAILTYIVPAGQYAYVDQGGTQDVYKRQSLRRLEAGGTAIWTGRDCSRCHCLRCRVSMREPGHLQNTTVRISGGFKK